MTEDKLEGIADYRAPAGGWGALKAVARALKEQQLSLTGVTRYSKQTSRKASIVRAARGRIPTIPLHLSFAKTARRRLHGRAPGNGRILSSSRFTPYPKCGLGTTTA